MFGLSCTHMTSPIPHGRTWAASAVSSACWFVRSTVIPAQLPAQAVGVGVGIEIGLRDGQKVVVFELVVLVNQGRAYVKLVASVSPLLPSRHMNNGLESGVTFILSGGRSGHNVSP